MTASDECFSREGAARPVLLVTLDWARPGDGRRSLGAASLVAALEAAQVPVRWVEGTVNGHSFDMGSFLDVVHQALRELGPRALVGIGCYVWNEEEVRRLLPQLRGFDVVLGGPQISFTAAADLAPRYPGVRYFVRGYGERAIVSLATGAQCNGQHGLFDVRGGADHGRRASGDLDELPSPYLSGLLQPTAELRWETQRGCPYRCSFCQHRDPHARYQHQPLCDDRIERELRLFAASGVTRISVLDPIFHVNKGRAIRVLRQARALGLRARISLQCRLELMSEELLDAMEGLNITLEFGLQTIHRRESEAVARKNHMPKVERGLAMVQRRGLDHEISLIYGLPHQTLESFRASVGWCQARGVPRVRAWPLMLLRGTPLHAQRADWGLISSEGPLAEVLESHSFTRADRAEMAALAATLHEAT